MPSRTVNPIDVIEAAYDLDLDAQRWLLNLATRMRPMLDDGHGLYAYFFDLREPPGKWLDRFHLLGADPSTLPPMRRLVTAGGAAMVSGLHGHPEPLEAATQAGRKAGLGDIRRDRAWAELLDALQARDFVALRTYEPEGRGIALVSPIGRERRFDRRTQRLWARVAAHIAAGRRIRAALVKRRAHSEAVLTPGGRIEHAEGPATTASAREILRAAVLRQEKARGRMRREDPEAATELWTALVHGRWSLVDRFERDGRRYLVARTNEHQLADPRALTARERAVVQHAVLGKSRKLIAYELGIAVSTVSTHLTTAMYKLGVSSRSELAQLAAFAPPGET